MTWVWSGSGYGHDFEEDFEEEMASGACTLIPFIGWRSESGLAFLSRASPAWELMELSIFLGWAPFPGQT